MGILDEHHRILKKMNNTGSEMRDRIFDYIINLSSCDEELKPVGIMGNTTAATEERDQTKANDQIVIETNKADVTDGQDNSVSNDMEKSTRTLVNPTPDKKNRVQIAPTQNDDGTTQQSNPKLELEL